MATETSPPAAPAAEALELERTGVERQPGVEIIIEEAVVRLKLTSRVPDCWFLTRTVKLSQGTSGRCRRDLNCRAR